MADYCCGPGTVANSGADWNNIRGFDNLTLVRGNTYWLADGTYASRTFDTPASGTTEIIIKKAVPTGTITPEGVTLTAAQAHGTNTGWVDTLGDGQAVFSSGIEIATSYWTIDGQIGGGPSAWNGTYGFKITDASSQAIIGISTTAPISNINIRHFDLLGSTSNNYNDALYIGTVNNGSVSALTCSHIWVRDCGRCPIFLFDATGTVIFEYFYVQSYHGGAIHSEIISSGSNGPDYCNGPVPTLHFRHSLVRGVAGTGGIMWDNGWNQNIPCYVYGNVFYRGSAWDSTNGGIIGGWTTHSPAGEDCWNLQVRNNTFIECNANDVNPFLSFGMDNQYTGNNHASNNLFYNCYDPDWTIFQPARSGGSHDYSHYIGSGSNPDSHGSTGSGNPFVDYSNFNFRLIANTLPGEAFSAPFNVDMYGNTRTTWTRGAVEFGGASPPTGTIILSVR